MSLIDATVGQSPARRAQNECILIGRRRRSMLRWTTVTQPTSDSTAPTMVARPDPDAAGATRRPSSTPDLLGRPSEMARCLHCDTVGWGSRAALRSACEAFGAVHVVPGSDFPRLPPRQRPL